MSVSIVDLKPVDEDLIKQIVGLLEASFLAFAPNWLQTNEARRQEVEASFMAGRRSRVMIDSNRQVLGWIAAFEDQNLWEIHPIAVNPRYRRQGYGMKLIEDVMRLARAFGAVAIWAGTSDETNATNLSSTDLYSDPFSALKILSAVDNHPVHFWQNSGFTLVGVMPDEEGLNNPGITFARRLD